MYFIHESFGTVFTWYDNDCYPTSRSPHTNHSTPTIKTLSLQIEAPQFLRIQSTQRIIPQTMNPPIDMKSNNILNPEKDTDTSRGDHLESKASSISSASELLPQTITTLVITIQRGKLKLFYPQII